MEGWICKRRLTSCIIFFFFLKLALREQLGLGCLCCLVFFYFRSLNIFWCRWRLLRLKTWVILHSSPPGGQWDIRTLQTWAGKPWSSIPRVHGEFIEHRSVMLLKIAIVGSSEAFVEVSLSFGSSVRAWRPGRERWPRRAQQEVLAKQAPIHTCRLQSIHRS